MGIVGEMAWDMGHTKTIPASHIPLTLSHRHGITGSFFTSPHTVITISSHWVGNFLPPSPPISCQLLLLPIPVPVPGSIALMAGTTCSSEVLAVAGVGSVYGVGTARRYRECRNVGSRCRHFSRDMHPPEKKRKCVCVGAMRQ